MLAEGGEFGQNMCIMNVGYFNTLMMGNGEHREDASVKALLDGVEAQVSGEVAYFGSEVDLKSLSALLSALGIRAFAGSKVEAFHVVNGNEAHVIEGGEGHFSGGWTLHQLFDRLADQRGAEVHDDDLFKSTVLLRYDEKTMLAFGMEQEAAIEGESHSQYWFGIFDAIEVEKRKDWTAWSLLSREAIARSLN